MADRYIIGSRDSQLALWQTNWVVKNIKKESPGIDMDIVTLKAQGDNILDVPLAKIGDKGLFTKELDDGLLNNKIDFAVHSLKDLPTKLPAGLIIASITKRWDCRDALISRGNKTLDELPQNAIVATGSLRRQSQLLAYRPDLHIIDIRGNLQTRFRKFNNSNWDAMILAAAGIERLNLGKHISEKLDFDIMLPGVGQGSLAIVCRQNDQRTTSLLEHLNNIEAGQMALAERSFLNALDGGCQVPVGAKANIDGQRLVFHGFVGSPDGKTVLRDKIEGDVSDAARIGIELAERLMRAGANEILNMIRGGS